LLIPQPKIYNAGNRDEKLADFHPDHLRIVLWYKFVLVVHWMQLALHTGKISSTRQLGATTRPGSLLRGPDVCMQRAHGIHKTWVAHTTNMIRFRTQLDSD
jgi:hypothetical protein